MLYIKDIFKKFGLFFSGCLLLALAGCTHSPGTQPPVKHVLAPTRQNLSKFLQQQGVQVIKVGQTLTIVLPSDRVFQAASANLRSDYRPILYKVVSLIRRYDMVSIKVAAYMDSRGNAAHLKALSVRQAEVIVDYLWAHNIDTRFIYAKGYGSERFVGNNATTQGRAENRRIEISFHFSPSDWRDE